MCFANCVSPARCRQAWGGGGGGGAGLSGGGVAVPPPVSRPPAGHVDSAFTTHNARHLQGVGQSPGPGATDLAGFGLCCFQARGLPRPQSSPLRDGVAEDASLPGLWQGPRVPGGAISILQLRTPKLMGVK